MPDLERLERAHLRSQSPSVSDWPPPFPPTPGLMSSMNSIAFTKKGWRARNPQFSEDIVFFSFWIQPHARGVRTCHKLAGNQRLGNRRPEAGAPGKESEAKQSGNSDSPAPEMKDDTTSIQCRCADVTEYSSCGIAPPPLPQKAILL